VVSSFDESEILPRTGQRAPATSVFCGAGRRDLRGYPAGSRGVSLLSSNAASCLAFLRKTQRKWSRELLHYDYAYIFEAYWDFVTPPEGAEKWVLEPSAGASGCAPGWSLKSAQRKRRDTYKLISAWTTSFLHEEVALTFEAERPFAATCTNWSSFTAMGGKDSGATGRLLWSESEERNLAQKLNHPPAENTVKVRRDVCLPGKKKRHRTRDEWCRIARIELIFVLPASLCSFFRRLRPGPRASAREYAEWANRKRS